MTEITDIKKIVCKLCNHAWISRVAKPVQCPYCKRTDYNKDKKPKEEIKINGKKE